MADRHRQRLALGDPLQTTSSLKAKVRLSCEACHRRKKKCDKRLPCANCSHAGVPCVPVERARLPRGRSGKRAGHHALESGEDSDLTERVSRLEQLVLDLTGARVGGMAEIAPLPAAFELDHEPLTNINHVRKHLFQLYFERVDPFFKILHRPSLSVYLIEEKAYLDYEVGHPAPKALACAIYHTAACTLDEEECTRILGTDRKQLLTRLHEELELALMRADYVMTNDLTVLQAFVLSVMALRSRNQSRRAWTLVGLAARIAQALSLHLPEPPFPLRPFEQEMRRRLWHAIGFLDIETAMDRASEPILQTSWFESQPLANINDTDIAFNMEHPIPDIPDSDAFTDMTFTIMILKAQSVARSLSFSDFTEPAVKSTTIRQQLILDFQQTASKLLQASDPRHVPFHWFAHQVAHCTNVSLQLISLRPLQRTDSFVPPRIRPTDLLALAATVLQRSNDLVSDPRSRPWRWIEPLFVPWHGLAVAIAELCVCDSPAVMRHYWPPVEAAFVRLAGLLADARKDLLWNPIEKLMVRARARRAQLLGARGGGGSSSGSEGGASSPFVEPFTVSASFTPVEGLDQWPTVWDVMDCGDAGSGNADETSWANYEDFIDDLHENIDYSLMSSWSGAVG